MDSPTVNAPRRMNRGGFTVFESIVAMFILLIGLLGVVAVFGTGMQVRMQAQELVVSGDLANMWADWIRFRLGETGETAGAGIGRISLSQLTAGRTGDFYEGTGDFTFGGEDVRDLPTKKQYAYHGYHWAISEARDFIPQTVASENFAGNRVRPWNQRLDGNNVLPNVFPGGPPQPLKEVTLQIYRGARVYDFVFVFSGVSVKYE